MKKILLLLTILISSNVLADWVYVTSADDTVFFVDPETIQKNGDKVQVWVKTNVPTGKRFKSSMEFMEFDCKNKTQRYIQIHFYSELDLNGDPSHSLQPDFKLTYIPPNTLLHETLKFSCK